MSASMDVASEAMRLEEMIGPLDSKHTIHVYRVGHRLPRPGDIAVCGHVKVFPTMFHSNAAAQGSGYPLCGSCYE